MWRDFVLRGSRPGLEGEEGNGDRKGDCIGEAMRLAWAWLRAAKERKFGGDVMTSKPAVAV